MQNVTKNIQHGVRLARTSLKTEHGGVRPPRQEQKLNVLSFKQTVNVSIRFENKHHTGITESNSKIVRGEDL